MTQILRLGDKGHPVRDLQAALNRSGSNLLLDGDFGPLTERAVKDFQRKAKLVVDGVAGPKTMAALAGGDCAVLLKEQDLVRAAEQLGIELAVIKAVNEVESRGSGFFAPGKPAILFERHIMHRQLSQAGPEDDRELIVQQISELVAVHPDLVNSRPGGYVGGLGEYPRLARAKMIDANAAVESTSWGLFQIMGFHWRLLGYTSADNFEQAMRSGEAAQLEAFVRFIQADSAMHKALKNRKWADFARRYNGPGFARNLYDIKLARAYERYAETQEAAA
ncbi:N-acetylmuramidase domain-containing protein [Pseudomonas jilinensis]|uniref:Peptidoglycan-binding protein n=1 Tax=Pseudomonas jilinensis TaxID=2078689 RepID=A0A396RYG3_9PSED|nr:N-acetylmuramidase family protein [Pseudomonas jilinensis]RHW21690.1 peptidoglycan-binding protein [Pseudomonas jilinensis]